MSKTKGSVVSVTGEEVMTSEAGAGVVLRSQERRFVQTKEYRRFVECCEECRASRSIGLCYGAAGVGKTEATRKYAQWDEIEPLLSWHGVVQPRLSSDNPRPCVALYTPTATVTARQIEKDIALLCWSLRIIGEASRAVPQAVETVEGMVRPGQIDLLVVDEADRLKPQALEVLRDYSDRSPMGLVLVGMPGLEKRLARYPQLYSRVGFVHQYRTLDREEQQEIIEKQIRAFGGGREKKCKIEKDALAQMIRMTGGNFRQMQDTDSYEDGHICAVSAGTKRCICRGKRAHVEHTLASFAPILFQPILHTEVKHHKSRCQMQRLLSQIKRIMEINPEVEVVNKEVVEAAREHLVFGKGI